MKLLTNTRGAGIVQSTIALPQSLDLKVISGGVEEEKTLESLEKMACNEAQCYELSRPQSLAKLKDWRCSSGEISKPGAGSAAGEVVGIC